MAFWRKPVNVVTLFHNPKSAASHEALVLLQKSLRYDKVANPQPANFDLEVIEPPLGMTGTQRATVLRALMLKEDRERAARRAADEKERAKAEAAGAPEGSKVLDEVAKEDVDWTNPTLPKMSPPLAVWWQQDDVASGSVDEVRHMIDRLKQDAWAGEGGGEPSITDKIKNWLS